MVRPHISILKPSLAGCSRATVQFEVSDHPVKRGCAMTLKNVRITDQTTKLQLDVREDFFSIEVRDASELRIA